MTTIGILYRSIPQGDLSIMYGCPSLLSFLCYCGVLCVAYNVWRVVCGLQCVYSC